jgi:hypothetical protein
MQSKLTICVLRKLDFLHFIISIHLCLLFCQDRSSFSSRPLLPEEGPLPKESAPEDNEAPETIERQDGDDAEDSVEGSDSNQSPHAANS